MLVTNSAKDNDLALGRAVPLYLDPSLLLSVPDPDATRAWEKNVILGVSF